jgi:PEP-CTERM motif
MKRSTQALFGAAVLSTLWAATPASATPISDFVDPADTTITLGSTPSPCPADFTCTTSSLSFVHNILDNGFALADIIDSATVAIHLTDENGSESYTYTIGLGQVETAVNVPTSSTDIYTLTAPSLADLQADGMISVKITITSANNNNSFNFADSTLVAQVTKFDGFTPSQNEIPVPSTLLLLGAGVAAFGWRSRRRS